MYCANCGAPCADNDTFCVNCGTTVKQNFFLNALRHPLFLTMCILITCGCGLSLVTEELSVISILLTIFFWLTYGKARKGIVAQGHLRSISGTLFASYVINFVIFGGIALAGGILAATLLFVGTGSWAASFLEIETDLQELEEIFAGWASGMTFISIIAFLFLIICLVIAIIGIIINVLGYRKIHKFAQSVYLNAYSENPILYKPSAVSSWLIVFGVLYGLSALSSLGDGFLLFLGNGAYSAAFIVGHIWIRKYFVQNA